MIKGVSKKKLLKLAQQRTGAGTHCGSCVYALESWLVKKGAVDTSAASSFSVTAILSSISLGAVIYGAFIFKTPFSQFFDPSSIDFIFFRDHLVRELSGFFLVALVLGVAFLGARHKKAKTGSGGFLDPAGSSSWLNWHIGASSLALFVSTVHAGGFLEAQQSLIANALHANLLALNISGIALAVFDGGFARRLVARSETIVTPRKVIFRTHGYLILCFSALVTQHILATYFF